MAQLELSVVLNLANFRTQLGKLAQASAAYYYPVNLTIDKQAFKKQLAALGNVKPIIKIEDSQLDAARKRIATLNKSLATLRRATATPIEIKLKYVEVGKPASAAAGQIGRAVSGGVRGSQALEGVGRSELLNIRKMMSEAGMALGKITSLSKATASELRTSIVPAFTNSGEQAINGLAIGLKDSSSKIGKTAGKVGIEAVNGIKAALGIASPSRVFKQIGEFSVDGLELGFLNGLKDFKTKAVAEIKSIVKSLQQEARVGMIAAGGLLSPVAGPRTASTRTIPGVSSPRDVVSNQDPGRSNNRILNSLSLLTGDPKLYRSRMANLGANRLPSSLLGSAATQMNLEEIAPSFKEARLGGTKTGVANIIDEAFFGRGTLPKASNALNALSNTIERLASSARAAAPSGILQSASGNPRFRAFGGVPSSQSMGIFPPTAQPTSYPPSGGFLEFSRRATAISAGLPGNVFGGREGGAGGGSGGGGGRGPGGGGTVPPGGFPIDDAMVTRNAKLGTVMDVAAASTRRFTASQIPLIGGIKSLAGEFGEATKQVLLYGTAYKGLAFLTSLPGQILNAAKSQQQFNNGLQVATQDTGTFAKELLYVDNVQRAFGLNLETTRTGFTRLYASMAPTGFDSGSIEKLFTGISAATAALQLTPDKAERVIYAFGQMASKGQIMSEELKGQLGDVLPGALAIFSNAAGMSVKEFSEAMEDGEFVGNRFREVFAKVSDELMNRFGTGAQVAGRSLQGLINTVGGDFQRTLESFAPLANAAAQATLGPLTGMLREVSMAAQIAMGEQDRVRKQLEAAQTDVSLLRAGGADAKEIKAAEQNVAALAAKYEVLNEAARDPAISQQVKNIEAFVAEIQKAATFTMNLAGVIGSILNPLFTFLGGNLTSVVGNLALLVLGFNAAKVAALLMMGVVNTMSAIQGITSAGAASTTILAGAFRLLGVQATGAQVATIGFGVAIKGLLISTGIGAVIVLLGSLATAFLSVGNKAKEAADRAKRSIDSMADAARTGNVSLIEMELAVNKADRQDVENLIKKVEGLTGKRRNVAGGGSVEMVTLPPELKREAKRLGIEVAGEVTKGSILGSLGELRKPLKEAAASGEEDLVVARKRAEKLGQNIPDPTTTTADTETEEDKKKTSLESYYSLQDQLAKAQTQADLERLEAAFEHARAIINAEYDLKEAKANSFQKKAIAFQKEIFAITSEQDAALFKNRNKVLAAAGSVAGGAPSGSGGSLAGMTQYITGDPSHPSYKPDHGTIADYHDHLAFASREAAIEAYNKLTKAGIKVTEFQGFGQGVTGPHSGPGSAHHKGLAMDVPGYQWGGSGAIGAREFAGSARVRATLGMGGGTSVAPGKVAPSIKRDELANQRVALTAREANASAVEKEAEAIAKLEIATANYVQSLVPTAEQSLQNQLLQQRIALTQNSFSPEILEAQLAFAEQELQVAENIKINTEEINRLTAASGDNAKGIKALTDANNQLKANLPVSAIQLLTKAIDDQVLSLVQRTKTAERDAADQERVNSLIIGGMTRQSAEAKVTAENLRGDYKKALEEATRQVEIAAAAEEVLAAARRLGKKETAEQTAEYNRLAQALKDAKAEKDKLDKRAPEVEGVGAGIEASVAPKTASSYIADGLSEAQEKLDQLTNTGYQVVQAANAIGDAFGTAFKGVVTGSMTAQEALAGMFQSIADHFMDMAAQMIAEYLKMQLIKGLTNLIGGALGSLGGGLSSGFNAGTSSAIDTGAAGWANSFATPLKFANGGIAAGGFQAFANGGIVTGPTLGLVGEGRYNEAVIPLPDGKSVPVKLSGGSGSDNGPTGRMQSAMARYGANARGESAQASNGNESDGGTLAPGGLATIDVRYSIERINNVEYVTASQFQEGMRQAAQQGAAQGEQRTLRRLQQSPSTRKRIGV
jgi:tape measure domain-containing protein